jgi:hypothetical protein
MNFFFRAHSASALLLCTFLLACTNNSFTKAAHHAQTTTEVSAESVIAEYRTSDPSAMVRRWQREITHPNGNPQFKEFQAARLKEFAATEFAPCRLNDPALATQVRKVFLPILQLYNRQDCFEIIVVDHPIPIMMNDDGVLLMVTTGLIARAHNDDELLGHVAHELGHDLHWRRAAKARSTIAFYQSRGSLDSPEARAAREELARIEMECDAFSAVTLSALGRNPDVFSHYLEATERDYPEYLNPDLPLASLRAKVITGVVPERAVRFSPQTTEAFHKLKTMLVHRLAVKRKFTQ